MSAYYDCDDDLAPDAPSVCRVAGAPLDEVGKQEPPHPQTPIEPKLRYALDELTVQAVACGGKDTQALREVRAEVDALLRRDSEARHALIQARNYWRNEATEQREGKEMMFKAYQQAEDEVASLKTENEKLRAFEVYIEHVIAMGNQACLTAESLP